MEQESRESVSWVAGAADGLELLARAFSFPDEELARALCDGRFAEDAASCAADVGASQTSDAAVGALRAFAGADPEALLDEMRQTFSRLYLVPGKSRTLYPYEGAFRFMADGRPGKPLIFANRAAADMEKLMKAEGLEPDPDRHEPADCIWFELAYLSLLYGKWWQLLEAGSAGDGETAPALREKIAAFQKNHGRPWMVAFMEQTAREAGGVYSALATLGASLLDAILGTSD